METRNGLIALVVGIALVAAGCGDDDDESTTTAEAITQEEFIAQADQICAEGDAAIEEAGAGLDETSSEEEVTAFLEETVLPNIRTQLEGIQALGVPEGDTGEVEELTTTLEDALAEAEADPSILVSDSDPFAEVNQMARDYGLTACGDG